MLDRLVGLRSFLRRYRLSANLLQNQKGPSVATNREKKVAVQRRLKTRRVIQVPLEQRSHHSPDCTPAREMVWAAASRAKAALPDSSEQECRLARDFKTKFVSAENRKRRPQIWANGIRKRKLGPPSRLYGVHRAWSNERREGIHRFRRLRRFSLGSKAPKAVS
jgi:hypothetical protein